jgi:spore germination cell wall hydrolase CwlJ-like protein
MKAVAHVIRNRVADGRWGKTPAAVCLWPLQFSGWRPTDPNYEKACGLPDDDPTLAQCLHAWQASESEPDPTDGACFYFSTSLTHAPAWAGKMIETVQIGAHIFYRDK